MSWLRIAIVEGSGSKDYHVSRQMDGSTSHMQWGCSCPAWTKGKSAQAAEGGERPACKHIKWVKHLITTGENLSDRVVTLDTDAQAAEMIAAFRLAEKIKAKQR